MEWFFLLLVFVGGFFVGVLSLASLEALGAYLLLRRLNRNIQRLQEPPSSTPIARTPDPNQSLDYAYNKKGTVWVLESDKLPKNPLLENVPREKKRKKDFIEVTPTRKYARIKDSSFILMDPDGSHVVIPLKGCTVEAVSATSLSSKKWAKRYPIKVESKTPVLNNACKTLYIYLETAWEKESWCKALRLASCDDKEKLNWFTKVKEEFHGYLTSLNAGYPSFMKPSVGFNIEPIIGRANNVDGSSSKVRLFFKKFSRKASKGGVDSRVSRINDKSYSLQDNARLPFSYEEENLVLPSSLAFSRSASQGQISVVSDVDSDDRFNIDDGTLCWNLLISRLFFDAKSKIELKNAVKARIQRTLSNMRIPSYIGDILCTDLDLGNLPPHIHGIRVLPTDMNDVWAWEVDLEYCHGLMLDIETRLEVGNQDLQKGIVDTSSNSSSVGHVSSDILEDFEHFGEQLNLSEGTVDPTVKRDEGDTKQGVLGNSMGGMSMLSNTSRWKSILNSIAKQVSQVPLSMSIRVASVRGTMRLHIKPPPSDQLWFGFTSMPDIEFDMESSVGEHKINSGHVALYLINRFKASIRDTMVLPNCESICIPWMLAEKNDWIPRNVAPFMWLNQEGTSNHVHEAPNFLPDNVDSTILTSKGISGDESKHQKKGNYESTQQSISDSPACSSSPARSSIENSKSLHGLETPLLEDIEPREASQQSRGYVSETQSPSRSLIPFEKLNSGVEVDDSRPKKVGRRAKMFDLGKKMGEKFEEKRRHIEEKGRNIVEKARTLKLPKQEEVVE